MISALNMELDVVRTVLSNVTNEVSVCTDLKREDGSFYTMVSIFSRQVAKEIAGRIALDELFSGNGDFVGSFAHKDALHLVFMYHPESCLSGKDTVYASSFIKRREMAVSFLTALAETEMTGDAGRLLVSDRNINVTPEGKVYLNYFLDFNEFAPSDSRDRFLTDAARYAFEILTREYAAKYGRQVDMYPHELRLMYKKIENKAFRSLSQMMAFVGELPDEPEEQRFGVKRLAGFGLGVKRALFKRPATVFLVIVVLVTLGYLIYQITIRSIANKKTRENTVYVGMLEIGEVYLGEENI